MLLRLRLSLRFIVPLVSCFFLIHSHGRAQEVVSIDCAPLELTMVVSCRNGHCDDGFNVRYVDVNIGFPCSTRPVVSSQPEWIRQLCLTVLKAKGLVDLTGIYEFDTEGLSLSSFLQNAAPEVTDSWLFEKLCRSHIKVVSGKAGLSDLADYRARWKWKCRRIFLSFILSAVGLPILLLVAEVKTLKWFFRRRRSRIKSFVSMFAPVSVQVIILAFITLIGPLLWRMLHLPPLAKYCY